MLLKKPPRLKPRDAKRGQMVQRRRQNVDSLEALTSLTDSQYFEQWPSFPYLHI